MAAKAQEIQAARLWQTFRERVIERGYTVLEPEWLGADVGHRVLCPAGHEYAPHPKSIQQGQGICRTCAGLDSEAAWKAFQARISAMGGVVLEQSWLGNTVHHRVRCVAGHDCRPRPNYVYQGGGICRICVRNDPETAWQAFRSQVEAAAGTVLETEWLGSHTPHRVRCANGHENRPRPDSIQQGRGICPPCSGVVDSATAEQAFRARVAELGGVVLEPRWLRSDRPHRVRCSNGHESTIRPAAVRNGCGICRSCTGEWNVFYVVMDDNERRLKFGITTGDSRPRLRVHARDGFTRVVRLLTGLPDGVAFDLERSALASLRLAGEEPVRGREYFDARVMALVLDIVDNAGLRTARA